MHIPFNMIQKLGGFKSHCITEDLEIGVRIWDTFSVFPKYLPIPCTEQTPSTLRGYFFQRLRWGKGIIDILLHGDDYKNHSKKERMGMFWKLFLLGPLEWYLYAILSVSYLISTFQKLMAQTLLTDPSYILVIVSGIVFMQTLYLRYFRFMRHRFSFFYSLLQAFSISLYMALVLPFVSILYGLPFICGTIQSILSKIQKKEASIGQEYWIKTPRTVEKVQNPLK